MQRWSAEEVIELVGDIAEPDQRIGTLSGGERRRLGLARWIVGAGSALLFLDELMMASIWWPGVEAWELVRTLCSGGT